MNIGKYYTYGEKDIKNLKLQFIQLWETSSI